jgi:hypothetical protein
VNLYVIERRTPAGEVEVIAEVTEFADSSALIHWDGGATALYATLAELAAAHATTGDTILRPLGSAALDTAGFVALAGDAVALPEREPDWRCVPAGQTVRRNVWMALWRLYWVFAGNPYPDEPDEYDDRDEAIGAEVFNVVAYLSPVERAGAAPDPLTLFYGATRFAAWERTPPSDDRPSPATEQP